MPYYNTPMTKLDAVNICLSSMGEPVINSLDGASVDAQMAADLIDEMSRSIQGQGWHWNRERHTLSPNTNQEILLPPNTARIDTIDLDKRVDVVQRGGRLFNRDTNSYTFDKPLSLEIYVILPFEDLPLAAKSHVTYRAARTLQQRILGSEVLSKFAGSEEQRSYIVLLQEEAEVADYNIIYGNRSTSSILSRVHFNRGVL